MNSTPVDQSIYFASLCKVSVEHKLDALIYEVYSHSETLCWSPGHNRPFASMGL